MILDFKGTARFDVIRRLGAGGMGVVYEALDRERGQRVALKALRHADADTLYRLKREFRSLADLSHPNLVALHDLIVPGDGEGCFFTMELVEGTDFISHVRGQPSAFDAHAATDLYIDKEPPAASPPAPTFTLAAHFDETKLRAALPQLALGLMAIHATGKIHRDVKPSNVLVTRDGRVVLVDFGLVTRADSAATTESLTGHVVGTVPYMAPEQCRGDANLTPAADWHAVGSLLYEALTGRVPFNGPMMRVLVDKQQVDPPPPRDLVPSVASDLDALCVRLLAREPDERPGGADVLRHLGVPSSLPLASLTTRSAPFAGRDAELAELEQGLAALADGQAAAIVVRGPSGIGKSTLFQRFLEHARGKRADLVVLQGRCYERETVPYQAMDSLIDNLSHYWLQLSPVEATALVPREPALLPRLFPVLGRVPVIADAPRAREIADPQELRTRAFAALREVLQRLGQRHPLVLVLDDMQWVDTNTLTVLADLMRPPDPPSLCLLLSTRPEGSHLLDELMRRMDVWSARIELAPLPGPASLQLAEQLLGPEAAHQAAGVAREGMGNPFFIGELVKYVQTVEAALLGTVTLDGVVSERLAHLSPSGRRILEIVALAGEPITRRALASAATVTADDLAREMGALRTLSFIRLTRADTDHRIEPFHDRVRDVLVRGLSDDSKRAHHRALARASEQWGEASLEQVVRHWHGAGELARAAEAARKAAEDALARLDFDRAANLYRTALDLGSDETPRRELMTALGGALAGAARPFEAAQAFERAAAEADKIQALELHRRSAEQLLRGGYIDDGLRAIRHVLGAISLALPRTPFGALVSLLWLRLVLRLRGLRWRERLPSEIPERRLIEVDTCGSVSVSLSVVDSIRGASFQVRHVLRALGAGEPGRILRSLVAEAGYLSAQGRRRRAAKVLRAAERAAHRLADPYDLGYAKLGIGFFAYFIENDWRDSLNHFSEAEALFRKSASAAWELDTALIFSYLSRMYLGQITDIARLAPATSREAERRGDRYLAVTLRCRIHVHWLARDDADGLREDLELALSGWMPSTRGYQVQHLWALLSRGDLELYVGAPAAAAELMARTRGPLRRSLLELLPLARVELKGLGGRIALASGDASRARRLARALRRERLPLAHAWAPLIEAGAARLEGQAPEAKLREAVAALDALGTMLYATAARRRLGETLGPDAGAPFLAEAAAWYAREGVKDPDRMTAMLAPGWP